MLATEVGKTKPSMVVHVRHGWAKHLTSIRIPRLTIQMPVLMETIVEIQMDQLQFGATLQIQKRDGKLACHWNRILDLKDVQERIVRAIEAAKTKPSMV